MDNIIKFRKSRKKKEKKPLRNLIIDKNQKVDLEKYALHLLSLLDNYVDHFENEQYKIKEMSEYIFNEFSDHIIDLKYKIKTALSSLAKNRYSKQMYGYVIFDEYALKEELEYTYKFQILELENWFTQMQIPLTGPQVYYLEKFRNIWS